MAEPADRKRKLSLSSVWRESKELLWASRWRLSLGLLLLLLSRVAGLVLPASFKVLIDQVIGQRRADLLPRIALVVAGASVAQAIASYLLGVIVGVAAQRSVADLRRKVQAHLGRLSVRFFDDHKSGELISRVMNDAEGIRSLVGSGFVQLVGSLCTASLAGAVLLWLNWRLTFVTMLLLGLFLAVMLLSLRRLRPLFRERGKITAEVTGRLAEAFGGIRVVKAYHAEKREERIFAGGIHRLLRNVVQTMRSISAMTSSFALVFGLAGTAMAWVGAREVLAGRMTVGDLVMYLAFTGLVVAPLIQLTGLAPQVSEAFAGLDRIREVLAEDTEAATSGDHRLGVLAGEVVFRDVCFAYLPGRPVLQHVSFAAAAGSATALVGPSGAGKSTLIRLVLAFDRPTSGSITVDGIELSSVHLGDYRRQLAVVLQDGFLFAGTIRENIAYSRPTASDQEIATAAGVAHCTEFVESLPDRYDTIIGERGIKLSGGQRQRLAIARAILADPRILILDEATSSLDSESEEQIQQGLGALMRGRTSFVIAHRLSTVRNADQILVIDQGRVVEHGRHEELLALGGLYSRLVEKQARLETNRFVNPGEDGTANVAEAEPHSPPIVSPELPFLRQTAANRSGE